MNRYAAGSIFVLVFACWSLLCECCYLLGRPGPSAPTDEQMIDHYYLSYYVSGLGVSGLRKGFLYTTDFSYVQERLVESTETQGDPLPRYREIDENWYIYLDD